MKRTLVILATSALVHGCTDAGSNAHDVVELGRLEFYQDPAMIDAPSTAPANTAIPLTVTTYGGGCLSFERTDVVADVDGALISPFDRNYLPDGDAACTADLRFITHTATLTFPTPGAKNVRVAGRHVGINVDEEIEVPVSITIE